MKCPNCNGEATGKFCSYCGSEIPVEKEQVINNTTINNYYYSTQPPIRKEPKIIKCTECSAEISNMIDKCPHCDYPVIEVNDYTKKEYKTPVKNKENVTIDKTKEKKKDSTLSIIAIILSLFTYTTFFGFIIAIIDLVKKDNTKKHIGSIFAIVFFTLYALMFLFSDNDKEETSQVNTEPQLEASAINEYNSTENEKESFEDQIITALTYQLNLASGLDEDSEMDARMKGTYLAMKANVFIRGGNDGKDDPEYLIYFYSVYWEDEYINNFGDSEISEIREYLLTLISQDDLEKIDNYYS